MHIFIHNCFVFAEFNSLRLKLFIVLNSAHKQHLCSKTEAFSLWIVYLSEGGSDCTYCEIVQKEIWFVLLKKK